MLLCPLKAICRSNGLSLQLGIELSGNGPVEFLQVLALLFGDVFRKGMTHSWPTLPT